MRNYIKNELRLTVTLVLENYGFMIIYFFTIIIFLKSKYYNNHVNLFWFLSGISETLNCIYNENFLFFTEKIF